MKRQAIAMMADAASTLGPLHASATLSDDNIAREVAMAEQRSNDDLSGEGEEDDEDNTYQESDKALPDDADEAAISRNPSREGSRFDET